MVLFKMFAGTNVGLRENNEDNFTVSPDLTKNEWIVPADKEQVIQLGNRGCVMVVADGMGGQNAGEVASAIAIDTIQEMFSPNKLPANIIDKPDAIKSFLKKVVSECDVRIKYKAEEDSSTAGMGSTIVISWLINKKLFIAWLGDSRAYSFIPKKGIARLSKDHSYVQQLVDAGAITEEEAMVHPNSNVITRSLGDSLQKAKADVVEYDVEEGQIILLCSDGLCGVCKDEEIGGIIEEEYTNLQKCKDCLTTAALAAGGSDNITISLMQIVKTAKEQTDSPVFTKQKLSIVLAIVFGITLILILVYAVYTIMFPKEHIKERTISIKVDKDYLDQNEKTKFHIITSDENMSYNIIFDEKLLSIDANDSSISRKRTKEPILKDSITVIRVVCKVDSLVNDSLLICLKKIDVSIPEKVEPLVPKLEITNESTDSENTGKNLGNIDSNPEDNLQQTNVEGKGRVTENADSLN